MQHPLSGPVPRASQTADDGPPAWLLRLAERVQTGLDRIVGRPPPDTSNAQSAEEEGERNASFERNWGIFYLPISLVIVLWLVLMVFWNRL
jgi:hypothetical protein